MSFAFLPSKQKNNGNRLEKRQQSFFSNFVQPKLTVNKPDDAFELQADAMADKVMRMQHPFVQTKTLPVTPIKRKCSACELEEKLQLKENNGKEPEGTAELESYVGSLNSSGQPLPNEVRNFYEPRFGYDFSNVKIHTDSIAAKSAQSIHALAYTTGDNIVFNSGAYAPQTAEGKKLLAHELTHVVQQAETAGASPVQKTMQDEHNLQSDNFSGDYELEACYDGETIYYLRTGNRGEAVQKMQQALLQLGYQLPLYGADGIFMQETLQAVKKFQADYGLITDGIVGTITIGEMDKALPSSKNQPPKPFPQFPPPTPEPEPAQHCNKDEEITLQTKSIPHKKTTGKMAAHSPVIQCKHITMRESMEEFSKKVNSSAAADPLVTANGQFYWSLLAGSLIADDIQKAYTMLDPIRGKVFELITAVKNDDADTIKKLIKEIPSEIEKSGVANSADLIKIFAPVTFVESPMVLWSKFHKEGKVPADFEKKYKNFNAFMQLRNAEKTLCWSVAAFMMKRFEEQGGYTDIDSSKKGKTKPSFTSVLTSGALRNFQWTGNKTKGDVVTYKAAALTAEISKIKSAIDDGFTLHARVLSGVNFGRGLNKSIKEAKGKNPAPKPVPVNGDAEHSLVIIGYEDTSDEFIFWDPDSSVSSYQGRTGFGILHLQGQSFTTAATEAEMLVDEDGLHSNNNKRYQVLTVSI